MISAYHQLFEIEKSFRMAKSDLLARPIYHHLRDSIEALTIVFAALAVSRWIEHQAGWSIRKFTKIPSGTLPAGGNLVGGSDGLPQAAAASG